MNPDRRLAPGSPPGRRRCAARRSAPAARDDAGDDAALGDDDDATTPTVGDQKVQAARGGFDPAALRRRRASVVTIISIFGDRRGRGRGGPGRAGLGLRIYDEGEIVTNAHVVTDAVETGGGGGEHQRGRRGLRRVRRSQPGPGRDRRLRPGRRHRADQGRAGRARPRPDRVRRLRATVEVGDPVAAIGSPFGQEQSLSTGIVSATDRSIESLTQFRIDGAIQTDASINPGNSGGPLIGADGKVIGVNQQINTTSGGNEGVGFAIPSNLVQRSVEDLRDDGEAEYAYIGVKSQPLYPQLAEELGIDAPTGSLISEVVPDGPADEPGCRAATRAPTQIRFQAGQVNRRRRDRRRRRRASSSAENDLSRLIAAKRPGETVTLRSSATARSRRSTSSSGARPEQLIVRRATRAPRGWSSSSPALREEVLPALGRAEGREHAGDGAGGDVTFAIDERAEARMEEFLAERAPDVAFYSEDRGMVDPGGEPAWVLVVDPIDGTRPAMAGLESACVSVAAARLDGEPAMGDVEVGCVIEIKSRARVPRGAGRGRRAGAATLVPDSRRADVLDLRLSRAARRADGDRPRQS